MAAVILCAGCGGGSTKKGGGAPPQVGPTPIVAKEGEFRTVIPRGYTDTPSVAQFWATGPAEGGFNTSVIVVREHVARKVDLSTYAHRLARSLRQVTHSVSHLERVSVDGEQGFAVDYLATATGSVAGKVTHVRQVLVKHGPWVIFIRDIALRTQYAESLPALAEVLGNWHWQ